MARQIEDMNRPISNNLTRMCLMDRHRLNERGCAAVLAFHSLFEFDVANFTQTTIPAFVPHVIQMHNIHVTPIVSYQTIPALAVGLRRE